MDDARKTPAARGAGTAATRCESSARERSLAAWGRRALGGAGGRPSIVGADGFFFVVLPDEAAVHARLERDGDVEADGQQRGEEQAAELHASIVRGAVPSSLLGREAVSHARLGQQVARPRGVRLELAAQVGHVHAQVVRLLGGVRPPDLL